MTLIAHGWDEDSRSRQNRLVVLIAICAAVIILFALAVTDPAPGEPGFEPTTTTEVTP